MCLWQSLYIHCLVHGDVIMWYDSHVHGFCNVLYAFMSGFSENNFPEPDPFYIPYVRVISLKETLLLFIKLLILFLLPYCICSFVLFRNISNSVKSAYLCIYNSVVTKPIKMIQF